jgi:PTS system, glucose subfamily, IIA component
MDKVTILVQMPVNGDVIPLSEVNSLYPIEKFSGVGVAVIPDGNIITAPISGTIKDIATTNHSLIIVDENGIEVLVHLGLDTQRLKGRGIATYVKVGEKVKKGDRIIFFDRNYVSARTSLTTPIVVLNPGIVKDAEKNIDVRIYTMKFGHTLIAIEFEKPELPDSQQQP